MNAQPTQFKETAHRAGRNLRTILVLFSVIIADANGALISFDPATTPGSAGAPISIWIEAGYRFSAISFFLHTDSNTLTNSFPDNGTAYIRSTFNAPQLILTRLDALPFNLISLDYAEFSTVAFPSPTTIIGHRVDGTTVSADMIPDGIIDGHGPLADFQTILFPSSFSNLTSVEIPAGESGFSLDNLSVQIVPEPGRLTLSVAGIVTLLLTRFRSRHCRMVTGKSVDSARAHDRSAAERRSTLP